VLDQIAIADLLDPFENSKEDVAVLEAKHPEITKAFDIADNLQKRIDTVDAPKLPHPKSEKISVGGVALHAIVTGKRQGKEPVVVFEAGLGCFSSDWKFVQDNLPSPIQAISYDRAGTGWSDKGGPPTPEGTIERLRTLLKTRGLEPPYVFVGHSYGGILGQLFALKYPDEIAGLVLVDSALESVSPVPIYPPLSLSDCLPPAAKNRYVQNGRGDFLEPHAAYAVNAITAKTSHYTTFSEELNQALPRASELLVEALNKNKIPFTMPLKVIAAAKYELAPRKTLEENEKAEAEWQAGQKALLSRSSSQENMHVMAPNSDHFVMYYDDALIRDQILSFYPGKRL